VQAAREEVVAQAQKDKVMLEEKCDARVASLAAGFQRQLSSAQHALENLEAELGRAQARQAEYSTE